MLRHFFLFFVPFAINALDNSHLWMKMCAGRSKCCRTWQSAVKASNEQNHHFLNDLERSIKQSLEDPGYFMNKLIAYDNFEPSWNCELRQRVPSKPGDGPKWTCGVQLLSSKSLVYSFGSNADVQFEREISNYTKDIFIFDPTGSKEDAVKIRAMGFNFIESGLVGLGQNSFKFYEKSYPGLDLLNHIKTLGHTGRKIDILKVDIEGSEFESFRNITIGECTHADVKIDQLLIEIHQTNIVAISTLLRHFMRCNMRIFSKERNGWGCQGFKCVEFSLVSPSHAFGVFRATHPSCNDIR
jgi:hypothetical protein